MIQVYLRNEIGSSVGKAVKSELYSVQAAASLAGISPYTLRAWESRYGVVTPTRLSSGHRRYEASEVARLEKIASLVRRGHSIGDIAMQPDEMLLQLLKAGNQSEHLPEPSRLPWHAQKRFNNLLEAIQTFDLGSIALEVKWLRTLLGVREFIFAVAIPLFMKLSEWVEESQINISQEHAISAVMRGQIGDLMHSMQALSFAGKQKPIIFASPEGDLHEFGILLSAALAISYGFSVYYAGANLPSTSLAEAARALDASLIVLGNAPVPPSFRHIPFKKFLFDIDGNIDSKVELWIGGRGDRPVTSLKSGRTFKFLGSLDEFDALLDRRARKLLLPVE